MKSGIDSRLFYFRSWTTDPAHARPVLIPFLLMPTICLTTLFNESTRRTTMMTMAAKGRTGIYGFNHMDIPHSSVHLPKSDGVTEQRHLGSSAVEHHHLCLFDLYFFRSSRPPFSSGFSHFSSAEGRRPDSLFFSITRFLMAAWVGPSEVWHGSWDHGSLMSSGWERVLRL